MAILDFITNIFKPASELIDKLTTTKEEKLELANKLEVIRNLMTEKVLEFEAKMIDLQSKIILAESAGNWLQRSWRPILMLAFGFVIIYEYFLSSILSLPKSNLPADFWELLKIGVGGYVLGRSGEKIVKNIYSKNNN